MNEAYDVIVVGGGHAGIEAAMAAGRLGARVAMALPQADRIGLMPCNPAIGGPGKSQLVFEIDAMGGVMGQLADQTAIHARTLNASKGPAVQSLRVQNERDGYANAARQRIEAESNVKLVLGEVASIDAEKGHVRGVSFVDGRTLTAPTVVLCTGTFLRGVVWYGQKQREAGRQGEAPSRHLSHSLTATGHALARYKTGTPPRVRSDSVDFSGLEEVPADQPPGSFSGTPGPRASESPTWLTHTTEETHALIDANLGESAMYSGSIDGQGPRYCPSIEDKVVKFRDKDRHLLFVEPDGQRTSEVYLQGFSSSMPPRLQEKMVRTLPGFENAAIQRYAYAVEYDALDPTQLTVHLMSKRLKGLFTAGQINGTSGYEEAAAQGLIAGTNAARMAAGMELVTVRRDQGYMGVMLDDLVRWGIDEPYRMLTSRNEYRLLHRQDNAEERLTSLAAVWGLVPQERAGAVAASVDRIEQEISRLAKSRDGMDDGLKLLRREGSSYDEVVGRVGGPDVALSPEERRSVEIRVRYESYIERSRKHLDGRQQYERLSLQHVRFEEVPSLSGEGLERLQEVRPPTLGAAQRTRGVRDSDVTALLVHLKRRRGPAATPNA